MSRWQCLYLTPNLFIYENKVELSSSTLQR